MKHGLVVMSAVVPTKGHQRLIRLAGSFCNRLTVVVSEVEGEPFSIQERVWALESGCGSTTSFHWHDGTAAPQTCVTEEDWSYWVNLIKDKKITYKGRTTTLPERLTHLFGSDSYCVEYARRLGLKCVLVDPEREVLPITGTHVRKDPIRLQQEVHPEFLKQQQKTFVLFGTESVGKTYQAKLLANHFATPFYHEWARPYLEHVKPTPQPTDSDWLEHMGTIARMQSRIDRETPEAWVKIQDTDLLSTIGYYELHGNRGPADYWRSVYQQGRLDTYSPSRRHYLVLTEGTFTDFVPDPLRYGGDCRESDTTFWINLLEEVGANYTVITEDNKHSMKKLVEEKAGLTTIKNYVRPR